MINTIHGFKTKLSSKTDARYKLKLIYGIPISRVNLKTGVTTVLLSDGTWKHKMFLKDTDVRRMIEVLQDNYTSLSTHKTNLTKMTSAERMICTLLDLTFKDKR